MNRNKTIIGIIIICIDQLTKNLVQVFDADVNIINNFLRIKYVQNTGAAFSLFKGHTTILILVSILLLVLVYNLMFSYKETKLNNIITPNTMAISAILNIGKLNILISIKSLTH